jgi:hypothetical protein
MESARKNGINNGIREDILHLIHKQRNYKQISLFYISWWNHALSKMPFPAISKPYMVGALSAPFLQ